MVDDARVYALVLRTSSLRLLLEVGSVNQQEAIARSVLTGLKSEVFRPTTV